MLPSILRKSESLMDFSLYIQVAWTEIFFYQSRLEVVFGSLFDLVF